MSAGSGPPPRDWSPPPPRARERRSRSVLYAVGGVVVVAVVVSVVLAEGWLTPTSSCDPPIPKLWMTGATSQIEHCGTRVAVGADSYVGYSAGRFSDAEILLGQYSSPSPIGGYLLNSSQFSALELNPHPASPPVGWFWSCGEVRTCNVNADVPPSPAEYFLVLINFGAQNVTVDWSQSLIVAYITVDNS